MDIHGSGVRTRLRHHQLVPRQYRIGGSQVRSKRGYGLAVGRREKPILGFPLKLFWGKCLTGMTYYPKKGKMNSKQAMDIHGSGVRTRLRHHQLVPRQYRIGGSQVRSKKGYGLAVGRREKPILGFPLKLFWGKCLTGMTYYPKKGKMSWNHQVHAIRDSERECPLLSEQECHSEQENKIRLFLCEWDVARPAQISDGGQATNRPVGGLGRTPTPRQKRLRGKIIKTQSQQTVQKGPQPCTIKKNITTPQRTTKEESLKKNIQSRKIRNKKEIERKTKSRQECDSRHAPID